MNTLRTWKLGTLVRINRDHSRAARSLVRRGAAYALVAFALATPMGVRDAKAFCKGGGCPAGTGGHEAITSQGLSFLNESVLDEINDEHGFIDDTTQLTPSWHFDSCQLQESAERINNQYNAPMDPIDAGGVMAEFDPADPNPFDAADEFGQALHIVQDFYSHSNWVDLGRTDLYESGISDWEVYDEWSEIRPGIVAVSEHLPDGWSAQPSPQNFTPSVTTDTNATKFVLLTGVPEGTTFDDCLDSIKVGHAELNKDVDDGEGEHALFAPAFDLAKKQTSHEWCRLLHKLNSAYGLAGPATAEGLWLANGASPQAPGTPCAERAPGGDRLVTAAAVNVKVPENEDDDPVKGDINLRLMLLTEDIQHSVRSQGAPQAGVGDDDPVTAPPSVSFCAYLDETIAVSLQGWDDDDGDGGVSGVFDGQGNNVDDALAGITANLGPVSGAAGAYIGSSKNLSAGFIVTVTAPDGDSDGLNDCEEQTWGSDPGVADTDGDGLSDGDEVHVYGTSPTDDDYDDDGLTDGDEVVLGTNPKDPDSDHDGLLDGQDVEFIQNAIASTPLNVFKSPSKGNRNAALSTLDDIEALLQQNEVEMAIQALEGLRKRFDGCGAQPDNNDWALVCGPQLTIRGAIDLLIFNLGG
jgi:hypothetical protein